MSVKKLKSKGISVCNKVSQANAKITSLVVASGMAPLLMGTCQAADAKTVMTQVISLVYKIFKYIGILLAVWGIGQLVLAFKNEDADSKSRAVMCLVSGVILFGLQAFASSLDLKL